MNIWSINFESQEFTMKENSFLNGVELTESQHTKE